MLVCQGCTKYWYESATKACLLNVVRIFHENYRPNIRVHSTGKATTEKIYLLINLEIIYRKIGLDCTCTCTTLDNTVHPLASGIRLTQQIICSQQMISGCDCTLKDLSVWWNRLRCRVYDLVMVIAGKTEN